jgi:hypothetical protein
VASAGRGDGQVSDRKEWTGEALARVIATLAT